RARARTNVLTLSLHDALPIYEKAAEPRQCLRCGLRAHSWRRRARPRRSAAQGSRHERDRPLLARGEILELRFSAVELVVAKNERDRKSTRLNPRHSQISYSVC